MKTLEFIRTLAKEGKESENAEFKMQQYFKGDRNTIKVSFFTKVDYNTPKHILKEKGLLLNFAHTGWFLTSVGNNQAFGYEGHITIFKEGLAYDAKKRGIELEDLQDV